MLCAGLFCCLGGGFTTDQVRHSMRRPLHMNMRLSTTLALPSDIVSWSLLMPWFRLYDRPSPSFHAVSTAHEAVIVHNSGAAEPWCVLVSCRAVWCAGLPWFLVLALRRTWSVNPCGVLGPPSAEALCGRGGGPGGRFTSGERSLIPWGYRH